MRTFMLSMMLVLFLVDAGLTEGPTIVVVEPQDGEKVTSPVDLEVDFIPSEDANIDPNSFRAKVKKPLISIDITDKVKPYVTEEGISVEDAKLPKGKHTIEMTIADDKGRTSSATTSVTVEGGKPAD